MNKNSSNSSSSINLKHKIHELESEIQNIKQIFEFFFMKFPEYKKKNEVPVLENSEIVVSRIKKALTFKPVKVKVLRPTQRRLQRFTNIVTRRRKSPLRASL